MDYENEIAIVGVGCRFPGADNLEELWRVLVNGENHVTEINNDRWNHDAFFSENKDEIGKYYVKRAGFLKNHDEWDHRLFGVSESEAGRIDPQQRYVLECTHMAMEDGGITRADLKNSKTGVYIGVMNDDYKSLCDRDGDDVTNYCVTGKSTTVIASRVSYTYDLRGPCMVIDTACSSAMTAIHLGSQALKTGDCAMAVCGGVSSIVSPASFIALCKARMMSAVGQCQTFCDTADGYARGEGCGIVMLKTVKRATEDGNKIWAIIRTGCNQDGHAASPITAPSGEQQEALLRQVYTQYGVDPMTLQYIEMHGTGTPIGDPTEVNALGKFITSYKHNDNDEGEMQKGAAVAEDNNVIKIGSIKSNIGHTESAAGAASLIKVLLMMKNGKLVPSLHIKKNRSNLNTKINLDRYYLDVVTDIETWVPNKNGERIACVNSFGFGGSNSHSIVIQKKILPKCAFSEIQTCPYKTFCISANDKVALRKTIERFGEDIRMNDVSISDVAYTCAFRRDHYSKRTIIYGQTLNEITENLNLKVKHIDRLKTKTKTRLVFVFCGVGTTWNGMCTDMMRTQPVFRAKIDEIDTYLEPLSGWCVAKKFECDTSDYSDPFLNHIAIFCTQVGLFAVWEHWGVLPDVIVGQSVGEVAAAVASQSLSLKDGIRVIYFRSKILAERTAGKMMVVGNLPVDRIQSICSKHDNKVEIAVYNSPTSCTLSGNDAVMEKMKEDLENMNLKNSADILIRPLSVQCAYHSYLVEPCMANIESELENLARGTRTIDHISTVTGEHAETNEFQTGKYWADNIRKPVKFMQALLKASEENVTNVFIEVGPRQVLRIHLPNIMTETLKGVCLPSMNAKHENTCMYNSLSELYEMGVALNWNHIVPMTGSVETIPRYCFNKTKILHVPEKAQSFVHGDINSAYTHMFVRPNSGKGAAYRIEVDKQTTPFVFDHFMHATVLVPGATYVEAAFEIGLNNTKYRAFDLSVSVEFENPLTISDDKRQLIQVNVTDTENNGQKYRCFQDQRTLCNGTIFERTLTKRSSINLEAVRDRCHIFISKEDSYNNLQRLGFKYGESLRLIENSWASSTECVVEMTVPDCVRAQTKNTCIHPAIIDGMFQSIVVQTDNVEEGFTFPKGAKAVVLNRPTQAHMFCYTKLINKTATGNHYNCLLLSPEGDVIAEIQDFYTKTMNLSDTEISSIVYFLTWKKLQISLSDLSKPVDTGTNTLQGKIIVFGTSKFIKAFMSLKNQSDVEGYSHDLSVPGMDNVYENVFSQNQNVKVILFAASHIEEHITGRNSSVYDMANNMFLGLSSLIQTVRRKQYSVTIYVITENVVACPKLNIKVANICGSELWGMVRSVISESAYPDIRLLDMSLLEENISVLNKLIRSDISNVKEYLLHEGKLYTSEFIESLDQDHETKQREIERTPSDTTTLKSVHPMEINDPRFQLNSNETFGVNDGSAVHIKPVSIVKHDISIHQITLESAEPHQAIWPENELNGFQVIALEGLGFLKKKGQARKVKHSNGHVVGFCYPVNVGSTVVVPSQCVIDISKIPVYIPGMMITSYALWNIAELCKHSMDVLLVVDDEASALCLMFENIVSIQKKARVVKVSKKQLDFVKTKSRHSHAYSAVILTTINTTQLATLQKYIQHLEGIVSVEQYVTKSVQRWMALNMKETQMHILNMDDLFKDAILIKTFPKVKHWMKSSHVLLGFDIKTRVENKTRVERSNPFTLPRETLALDKGQPEYKHISLKVLKAEVFRKDGCYILVGGLTGLGWELLQLMAELGAGYLVTFSRSPPADDKLTEINNIQKQYGCKIICVQVDITNLKQLDIAIKTLQAGIGNAYLKGIFHGGGVVNDKLLLNMTRADVEKTLQPKIMGTWNLHVVTKDMPLDFFVMHSSIVSLFGNSGQSNYAAGNSFQDSFAHYRRGKGLCGQSINWSTLSVGMATRNKELENKLRNEGLVFLSREDMRSCFINAVMTNQVHVSFGLFDWSRLQNLNVLKLNPSKFDRVLEKYGNIKQENTMNTSKPYFNVSLFNIANTHVQKEMIETLIKVKVTELFVVEKDSLNAETRFVALGIDSMAAMSFTNSIFEATQVRIPVVMLLSDTTTLGSLTAYILDNIDEITMQNSSLDSSESHKIDEYLEGNVTFMQKEILRDYLKKPRNGKLIKQAEFELKGVTLRSKDLRTVMNHLLKMNQELHKVYVFNDKGTTFDARQVDLHTVDVDLQDVPFDSICTKNAQDKRNEIVFDLTKDLPIKLQFAFRGDITRIRMYIHGVVADMRSMAVLFRDFATYMAAYCNGETLPDKTNIDLLPAEQVRIALRPRLATMQRFWKQELARDIQPFTFAKDVKVPPNLSSRCDIKQIVPPALAVSIIQHLEHTGNSLYNFTITAYIILLHEKTGKHLIPIYSRVDMSGHVPNLATIVTRATNAMPVIGDVRNMGTVKEYMKMSSKRLLEMTEQGSYPYELIEREMQSDTLRNDVGRHRFIMHNKRNLHQILKHKDVTIKVMNVFHKTFVDNTETILFVIYDLPMKKVEFELNYATACLGHKEANELLCRLIELMKDLIEFESALVKDLLRTTTATMDVSSSNKESIPRILPEETCKTLETKYTRNENKGITIQTGGPTKTVHYSGDSILVREDIFQKQTSQGRDHTVRVVIARDTTTNQLLLCWGKGKANTHKSVRLELVREAHVKKLNALYGILIKLPDRLLVLKTWSRVQAMDWFNAFKSEMEEYSTAERGTRL